MGFETFFSLRYVEMLDNKALFLFRIYVTPAHVQKLIVWF